MQPHLKEFRDPDPHLIEIVMEVLMGIDWKIFRSIKIKDC